MMASVRRVINGRTYLDICSVLVSTGWARSRVSVPTRRISFGIKLAYLSTPFSTKLLGKASCTHHPYSLLSYFCSAKTGPSAPQLSEMVLRKAAVTSMSLGWGRSGHFISNIWGFS
jgi:hypothetical protein